MPASIGAGQPRLALRDRGSDPPRRQGHASPRGAIRHRDGGLLPRRCAGCRCRLRSEPANHALRYAIEEATLHDAKVTLLHVEPSDTETEVYYLGGAQAADAGFDRSRPTTPCATR